MSCKHLTFAIIGVFTTLLGCSGPAGGVASESPGRAALVEVGEVYRTYSADHAQPPKSVKDFVTLRPVGPAGVQALESGEVVLLYGATMTDTSEGPAATASDQVLAYAKQVPESGGDVLLLDRRIKKMTADEFKVAPKAGK